MNEPQTPKRRGCFFYGCLTLVVLVLIGGLAAFFGLRYAVNKAIDTYTDTAPVALPKVEASAAEIAAVTAKVAAFKTAVTNGTPVAPLTLEEKELNILIANSPDFAALKDKAYVALAGDQVTGQISIPMDKFPIGRTRGRFLNGSAGFNVSLENGVLIVTLRSLEVKGQEPPEPVMVQLQQQNLAKDVYQNPQVAETLRKLESVQVKDGHVTIKARSASPNAEATK